MYIHNLEHHNLWSFYYYCGPDSSFVVFHGCHMYLAAPRDEKNCPEKSLTNYLILCTCTYMYDTYINPEITFGIFLSFFIILFYSDI